MANDDDIPTLDDVVRPGNGRGNGKRNNPERQQSPTLTDEEIEAIAARVMERYSEALEKAIERAIRRALERKEENGNHE